MTDKLFTSVHEPAFSGDPIPVTGVEDTFDHETAAAVEKVSKAMEQGIEEALNTPPVIKGDAIYEAEQEVKRLKQAAGVNAMPDHQDIIILKEMMTTYSIMVSLLQSCGEFHIQDIKDSANILEASILRHTKELFGE